MAFLKEALAKKDGDLERIQKESRSKGINDSNHEKPRVKASHSNGSVHGQGNRRQPLEEVRNAEVTSVLEVGFKNQQETSNVDAYLSLLMSFFFTDSSSSK